MITPPVNGATHGPVINTVGPLTTRRRTVPRPPTFAQVLAAGTWHPLYAHVLVLAVSGLHALALINTNGDGREIHLDHLHHRHRRDGLLTSSTCPDGPSATPLTDGQRAPRGLRCTLRRVAADSYADMLERLFADYEHEHRLPVIEEVAAAGRDDLAGQTSPGAEFELLERLVRQRLDELSPSGPG